MIRACCLICPFHWMNRKSEIGRQEALRLNLIDHEQPPMLAHGIAIRHPRNVIGNLARLRGRLLRVGRQLVIRWQQVWLLQEGVEQLGDDAARLAGHAVDQVMLVQVLAQEALEQGRFALHRI